MAKSIKAEDDSMFSPSHVSEDDTHSDYGSEFTTEEVHLLNELLSRITPLDHRDDRDPKLEGSSHPSTPVNASSNERVIRTLGRESRSEKDRWGLQATAMATIKVEETVRSLGDATRARADDGQPRETSEPAEVLVEEPEGAVDLRSPLLRFRTAPKKPLSVTDLVSPSWCELQYWYSLTKHGRKRRTAAMKQGTVVHQTLQDQVHQTVSVETKTREDAWGLRIWNVVQSLKLLRETGLTRELEVWGIVDGAVIIGVIDELSYQCPDRILEAEAKWTDEDAAAIQNGSEVQTLQRTLDEYLKFSGASKIQDEAMSKKVVRTGAGNSRKIYITDVKTRTTNSLPKSVSFRPTLMQLMIYHRLLSGLASDEVDASIIFDRYRLDASARFSDSFIAEVGNLNRIDDFYNDNNNNKDDSGAIQSSQDSLDLLTEHNSLEQLWSLMMQSYQETFPAGRQSIGDVLQAEYRRQADGSIMGSKTFLYDAKTLQTYLADEMSWWKGEREAVGVPIEEAYKCRSCEFAETCTWRNGKVEEAVQNHRRRSRSVV